jgi:hypothetical protein
MTKALLTLWVRFAGAPSLLSRRFQRASAPLSGAELMRMRLVSLATVILRKTVTQLIRAIPNCAAGGRCGIWFTAGNEGGKRQAHTPEERGPRCRRRAQSPAPCAIVESCTRCTCAEEPLVYSRDKGIAQVALNWVKLTLTVSSGRDAAYGRCATQRRKCFCFDHLFLSTSAFAVFFRHRTHGLCAWGLFG